MKSAVYKSTHVKCITSQCVLCNVHLVPVYLLTHISHKNNIEVVVKPAASWAYVLLVSCPDAFSVLWRWEYVRDEANTKCCLATQIHKATDAKVSAVTSVYLWRDSLNSTYWDSSVGIVISLWIVRLKCQGSNPGRESIPLLQGVLFLGVRRE